mmetsp:Transcript_73962/g.128319  ORF Transcript_73962/g.128319 Transcript_73962/m.128319 type:complete len:231 (+) Transcript_73962:1370-2062(+)
MPSLQPRFASSARASSRVQRPSPSLSRSDQLSMKAKLSGEQSNVPFLWWQTAPDLVNTGPPSSPSLPFLPPPPGFVKAKKLEAAGAALGAAAGAGAGLMSSLLDFRWSTLMPGMLPILARIGRLGLCGFAPVRSQQTSPISEHSAALQQVSSEISLPKMAALASENCWVNQSPANASGVPPVNVVPKFRRVSVKKLCCQVMCAPAIQESASCIVTFKIRSMKANTTGGVQ